MANPADEHAAGEIPEEMTPEHVREIAYQIKLASRELPTGERLEARVLAAASAWEADRTILKIQALGRRDVEERYAKALARLEALPAKDAESLARVCMSFAEKMLHKQDDIGHRFWSEQAKRLRTYAALTAQPKDETMQPATEPRGLYRKYIVTKADGSPVDPDAQYLVLRLDKGEEVEACREAAKRFATCVYPRNFALAEGVRRWVNALELGLVIKENDDEG